ncbi:MAG: 16S rRNA (guanine(966)-N(2))-methyltransferase RsmD [Bacteroidia bacterium]|nr:16S rRNA (guanine(966)-N(2))-methyltransferase RsmD [Bacteroidia bacterium]
MRIIGGSHRSRRIGAPRDLPLRPTTDFAKESLFNILQNKIDLQEIRVLDLFCGTGAISFEFSSRGAAEVIAVDTNAKCTGFIREKAGEFGFSNLRSVRMDAFGFLETNRLDYDIIFADPPYDYKKYRELVKVILNGNALKPNGLLIVEHEAKMEFPEEERFLEKRTYGAVNFSFFQKDNA